VTKRRHSKTQRLNRSQVSIEGEAEYIVERASQHEARIVSLGRLVFF